MARRPFVSLRVLRRTLKEGIVKGHLRAIYEAYTDFNRKAYTSIIAEAPVSRTPSQRFPAGMVKSHIKLVTKRRPPYVYQEVDVPERDRPRSLAWRTWVIIHVLHDGWTNLPFEKSPKTKQALSLPLFPGRIYRPGETRTIVSSAIQSRQVTLNPWIARIWARLEPEFSGMLEERIARQTRKKKRMRVER